MSRLPSTPLDIGVFTHTSTSGFRSRSSKGTLPTLSSGSTAADLRSPTSPFDSHQDKEISLEDMLGSPTTPSQTNLVKGADKWEGKSAISEVESSLYSAPYDGGSPKRESPASTPPWSQS